MKKLLLAFVVLAPFGLAAPASAAPALPGAASSADPIVSVGRGHRGHGMRHHHRRHHHHHRRRHHH